MTLFLLGCPQPTPSVAPASPPPTPQETAHTGDLAPPPRPNILLFLLDDVGPERLSLYDVGATHTAHTPVIDELAERGVVFDRAYSTPLCSSTRAALLTGRLPFRNGVGTAIFPTDAWELDESETTLAEAFRDEGYATAAFGKWHLNSFVTDDWETHPNRHGFDHFDGTIANLDSYSLWLRTRNGNTSISTVYHTQQMALRSEAWLDDAPEPWFAYIPLSAAHAPWHAPPEDLVYTPVADDAEWGPKLDAMIETIDITIGYTLLSLPQEVRDRTIVVIMGDNGTPDQVASPPADPTKAKGTLYEGGIRVPLIVLGPGIQPGRTEALASVVDIWPTLFDLSATPPPDVVVDGVSLVPILDDPSDTVRDSVYMEAFVNTIEPTTEERGQLVLNDTHKLMIDRGERLSLHRFADGALNEGPDLLGAPLSADDQVAYEELWAEYLRQETVIRDAQP